MLGRFSLFGMLFSQNCAICGHHLVLHMAKGGQFQCEECGCSGFPEETVPDLTKICTCGHSQDAHYHGEGTCGECACFAFVGEEKGS